MDLDVWACPVCRASLEETSHGLRCPAEDRSFRTVAGLPLLLRSQDEPLLKDANAHAEAWKRDALAPPPGRVRDLPYVRGATWVQKARSLEALLEILGPPRARRAADVGAGTGWLSYRLAEAGFRCYATDLSADTEVGLGAAVAYDRTPHSFERAIATLGHWPFRDGSIDVAICNASLHYLADVRPTIDEAARALRPGGVFIAMNDPVHRDPVSAAKASGDFRARLAREGGHGRLIEQHRHFVASELDAALHTRFEAVHRYDPDFGARFRATRWMKSLIIRMELASFPIYVATRAH
jgi:SAM-dependent methyltransferase